MKQAPFDKRSDLKTLNRRYNITYARARNTGPVSEILRQISDQSEYYGHGIIKLVLIKKNNEYHLKSGVISLLQNNEKIIEETRDYGDIIFKTELFNT